MRKVLFVATVTRHIIGFHIPYLKWFKEKGYEVHVASFGDEPIAFCDKHFNIPFARFPFKPQNCKAYKELKKIINDNEYEIIHCHTPVGGVLTRLAARKAREKGTKVFYTAHGFHFYKGTPLLNWIIYYPIEKYLSKYTDCLITINQEDYERAKKKFKAKRTELVHGVGVNKSKFDFIMPEEEKKALRKSLNLKDDDFVLLQVGELNKNKNQTMSINAMRELVKINSQYHLLLVGEGGLKEKYEEEIKEYNLQDNVHILGYRNDVPKLMKISNILLSLSYREGLPVNVIEASMSKLPVIATNCRGSRDIASKVIEINDIVQLCDNIISARENKESYLCSDYSKYELDNVLNDVKKLYEEVN